MAEKSDWKREWEAGIWFEQYRMSTEENVVDPLTFGKGIAVYLTVSQQIGPRPTMEFLQDGILCSVPGMVSSCVGTFLTGIYLGYALAMRNKEKDQMIVLKYQAEIQRTQLEIQSRQTNHLKQQVDVQEALEKDRGLKLNHWEARRESWEEEKKVYWWNDGTLVHDDRGCPALIQAIGRGPASDIVSRPICTVCLERRRAKKRRTLLQSTGTSSSDATDSRDMAIADTDNTGSWNDFPGRRETTSDGSGNRQGQGVRSQPVIGTMNYRPVNRGSSRRG